MPKAELAVSNISWPEDRIENALQILEDLEVTRIDVAAGMAFPKIKQEGLRSVSGYDVDEFRNRLAGHGIRVAGMQSLTFGRHENIFTSSKSEIRALREHLTGMFSLGDRLGARTLIYGSPGSRQTNDLSPAEIQQKAQDFFVELDPIAANSGVLLGIEPVSALYTNGAPVFGGTAHEVINFVSKLNDELSTTTIRFVPDTFAMHVGRDNPLGAMRKASTLEVLAPHLQIAEPGMSPHIPQSPINHGAFDRAFSQQLKKFEGESPIISIEMTPNNDELQDLEGYLTKAVTTARDFYARSL